MKRVHATKGIFSKYFIVWGKGATAYEFQVGKHYLRVCHLKGDYWAWKPWRRFSLHKESN